MPTSFPALARKSAPFILLASLILAGCTSDDRSQRRPGGGGRPVMATLTGQEKFFEGSIVAEVRIGAMAGFERAKEAGNDNPGETAHQGRRRRDGGGMGGPGGDRENESRPTPGVRRMAGGDAPPVAIHLRFTNQGARPVDVEITDFISPLSNFVVQPSHLALAPGQSAEVEPMGSRLANDATSGEISLTLRLDGTKETKIVTVQVESTPQAAPAKG
jgi:hypothetical protein